VAARTGKPSRQRTPKMKVAVMLALERAVNEIVLVVIIFLVNSFRA